MYLRILFFILFFSNFFSSSIAQNFEWVVTGGGSLGDQVNDIEIGPQGNIYICGEVHGDNGLFLGQNVSTTNQRSDGFVAKLTPDGNLIWYKQIMSTGDGQERSRALSVDDNGNCYVIGQYEYTVFFDNIFLPPIAGDDEGYYFAKISSSGVWQWANQVIENDDGYYYDVKVDQENNILVSGKNGTGNANLIKYNSNGIQEWVYNTTSLYEISRMIDIEIDSNNDIYVMGRFKHNISFGSQTIEAKGVDNYLFDQDAFVAKFNSNGIFQWVYHIGGIDDDYSTDMDFDENDNLFIGLRLENDCFFNNELIEINESINAIAKITPNQELLDFYILDYATSTIAMSIDLNDEDDIIIGSNFADDTLNINGQTIIPPDGSTDGYIMKYNQEIGIEWFQSFGGSESDRCIVVTHDNNGFIYLGGEFEGNSTFGNISINPIDLDNQDLFVAKYLDCNAPEPEITYNSNLTICEGNSLELSANYYNGATYQWYNQGGLIQGANQAILIVSQAGDYSVNISLGGTCNSTSEEISVELESPEVELTAIANEICPENDITQIFPNIPFASYLWSDNSINNSLEVSSPGFYSVTVTTSLGCTASDDFIIGSLNASPSPNLEFENCIIYTDSTIQTNVTYHWIKDGITILNDYASINTSVYGNGLYSLNVEGGNGCITSSPTPIAVADCFSSSLNSYLGSSNFKVYPNPVDESIFLSGDIQNIDLCILFNSKGSIIKNFKEEEYHNGIMNVSNIPAGIYFLEFQYEQDRFYKKIIIF